MSTGPWAVIVADGTTIPATTPGDASDAPDPTVTLEAVMD
jgi:hypothetical protein